MGPQLLLPRTRPITTHKMSRVAILLFALFAIAAASSCIKSGKSTMDTNFCVTFKETQENKSISIIRLVSNSTAAPTAVNCVKVSNCSSTCPTSGKCVLSSGSASKMYFFKPVSNNTMCNFTVAASSNTMVGVYTAKSSTGTDLCNYGSVGGMAWYRWALIAILVIVLIAGVLAAAAGGFLMWKKKQQASLYDQA